MTSPEFTYDCTQCAALCCMAPMIAKSERFPIDKPSGTACQNLECGGMCKIHDDREALGYKGCIDFSCLGAGPVVTNDLFSGKSWQDDDTLREPMTRAFLDLYRVQEARWLLTTAAFMGLPPVKETERKQMLETYDPGPDGWSEARLHAMLDALSPDTVREWLRGLAGGAMMPGQSG